MEELLSLKWNNHKNSFLQLLTLLRNKSSYTDVTLACDGQLYNVHKIVLSACSDYFSNIFENISCPNPVIVLKDMSSANLESLLDYMYLGEVNVKQSELSSLMLAAECLRLKGLAISETSTSDNLRKRSVDASPIESKRLRSSSTQDSFLYQSKLSVKDDIFEQPPIGTQPSTADIVVFKAEDNSDDVVNIKQETSLSEQYTSTWDFNPNLNDTIKSGLNQQQVVDTSQYDTPFCSHSFLEGDTSNNESISNIDQPLASSSQIQGNSFTGGFLSSRKQCPYCIKKFKCPADLTRHIRIHTGEKPFACPHCSYRANRKSNLNLHIFSKHKEISKNNTQ